MIPTKNNKSKGTAQRVSIHEKTSLDPDGVSHETEFWRGFVKTERFKGWVSDTPTPELNKKVIDILLSDPNFNFQSSKILDVGSGPVSLLRGLVPNLSITTCDPLSDHYQSLFDYLQNGIEPPFPYAAEDLPSHWDGHFDVVHISNALDHVVHPLAALDRLSSCVKPGGLLIIQGHVNEADHERRAGFHQHNLRLSGEHLVVESLHASVVAELSPALVMNSPEAQLILADQSRNISGRDWLILVIKKSQ